MILTVTVEVDKADYKQAIVDGWRAAYDEELDIMKVSYMNNPADFQRAAEFMSETCFVKVEVQE